MPGDGIYADTWIYAIPAEWEAIDPDIMSVFASYAYDNAITGFWDSYGTYEVYNVLSQRRYIYEITDQLTDVYAVYGWEQGNGADDFEYITLPADILAVMKDHIVYDDNGDIVSQTPATYENPNWGHVFFGQTERIFAGGFSNGFDGGFK